MGRDYEMMAMLFNAGIQEIFFRRNDFLSQQKKLLYNNRKLNSIAYPI